MDTVNLKSKKMKIIILELKESQIMLLKAILLHGLVVMKPVKFYAVYLIMMFQIYPNLLNKTSKLWVELT